MSVLNDVTIRNACMAWNLVTPFRENCLQPASYELTLDSKILLPTEQADEYYYSVRSRGFYRNTGPYDIAATSDAIWSSYIMGDAGFKLEPGGICLGSSAEKLKIPGHLMARFEGKSTLGRVFLAVHITAGYVDPGFEGDLTLEIANLAPWPIILRPGDKIGQLSFHAMNDIPDNLYGEAGNHYQGQSGATPCR